jgi:hypothetical protein
MKKSLLTTALATLALTAPTYAVISVSLTENPNSGPQFFIGATSSLVQNGSLVRIGTFDSPPTASSNFATYAASFKEFARTTFAHSNQPANNIGRINVLNITGGTGAESPLPDTDFIGKSIYVWVYTDADGDASGQEAQGLFQTNLTFAEQPTAVATSMTSYVTAYGSTAFGQSSVDLNANVPPGVAAFHLAPGIPEPTTTATLGLLAALGLMRRRR